MVYKGEKDWIEFKKWMKSVVLCTHLPENHKKGGDLKFPKYMMVCSCGEVDCNNLRRDKSGIYGKSNLDSDINRHDNHEHGYYADEKEQEHTNEVYIKESEVELMKGQIHRLDWYERKDLIKRLK